MSERFAIYLSFAADDPLTKAAGAWLSRDAFTGERMVRPAITALDGLDLDALTEDPRRYGFHATLKAPFDLAPGTDGAQLRQAFRAFAEGQTGFDIDLAVSEIGSFIAFTLAAPSSALQALHEACLTAFEPFRAPLSQSDFERRGGNRLAPGPARMLQQYGYAGVMEYFKFHMTLTGRLRDPAQRTQVLAALKAHFAAHEGTRPATHIALFRQTPDRSASFCIDTICPLQ